MNFCRTTLATLTIIFGACVPTACDSELAANQHPLLGRSFVLNIEPVDWFEPQGAGQEIGSYVPRFSFQFVEANGDELGVVMATTKSDDAQDTCAPTSEFHATSMATGGTRIGPADFHTYIVDSETEEAVPATIYGMQIVDDFATVEADDVEITTEFSGFLDVREVVTLFKLLPDPDPDSVCRAIESFGGSCMDCAFGDGGRYCVRLAAQNFHAHEVEAELVAVGEHDIASDCR